MTTENKSSQQDLEIKLPFQDILNHHSGLEAAHKSLSLFREEHMRKRYRNGDARFFLEEFDEIPDMETLKSTQGSVTIPSMVDECFRPEKYGVKTFSSWEGRQKRSHCFKILNSYMGYEQVDNKLPERWLEAVGTLYPGQM